MSEYKTLKDAPIGEWIESLIDGEWDGIIVRFKGSQKALFEDIDGDEYSAMLHLQWRYPIDPLEELENKILDLWRGQDVAYACDEWKDIPHRWVLQVMLDAGADIERVK